MLNILGIITSVLSKITDTFNRSDGSLGTSSSGNLWSILSGTWAISSNQATSSTAASSYPLATVDIGAQNVIVSADITDGGPGIAFWVTDANSWWASSVNYSSSVSSTQAYYTGSTVQTGTTSGCFGAGGNSSSGGGDCGALVGATPASCSSSVVAVGWGNCPAGCTPSGNSCVIDGGPSEGQACDGGEMIYSCSGGSVSGACSGGCGTTTPAGLAYYTGSTTSTPTYGCAGAGGNPSSGGGDCGTLVGASSTTTYLTELKLYKNVSGTVSTVQTTGINSNNSAFVEANSIKASTSGDDITITAYQSSGLSSAFATTLTNTPATPLKGTKAGIIKTPSSANSGSLIDNFSAESL